MAVERALHGFHQGGGAKIVREHRGPGHRLKKRPVQANRTGQRRDDRQSGQPGKHKRKLLSHASLSNPFGCHSTAQFGCLAKEKPPSNQFAIPEIGDTKAPPNPVNFYPVPKNVEA